MKQLFLMVNDGTTKLIDTPAPLVKDGYVIVETLYSVVSAGTERGLTSFGGKNLIQKAMERPDQVKKVTEKISTDGIFTTLEAALHKLSEPMPMGYSGVGRVIECGKGVTEVSKGDLVAMAGQAYHSEVNRVNKNLIVKVPENLIDYRQAAFCALGGIALEGIHQADVKPGETVAVIGMGLLGHIVSRILTAYGCQVIGYDVKDKSLPNTELLAFIPSNSDIAEDMTKGLTKGRGVDKVIITAATESNGPMDLAAAISRDRGIICMVGVTKMDIDRRPFYQKELTFTMARSYGPGRYDPTYEEKGIDYPIGYIRFTEQRNIEEFIRLLTEQRLQLSDLITNEIPFEHAADAYEIITNNKKNIPYIGILLKYEDSNQKWDSVIRSNHKKFVDKEKISVGIIGAGNFAKSTLLPIMQGTNLYQFIGLANTGGIGAAQIRDNFEFQYLTNDYKSVINDSGIDLLIISTQHDSHSKFVIEGLKAGKSVYCEKPLCLTLEELDNVKKAYENSKGELFCGMNRRHAPLIEDIKKIMNTAKIPAVYNYIVNAGFIPKNHWTQDESIGGGRIIGESCHFVDVIQYLDESEITSMDITYADNDAFDRRDNATITIKMKSGAVANILYTSMGSKKYPKEQLQVFSNGCVCMMNNFVRLDIYGTTKKTKRNLKQDKGIENEYKFIYNVLKGHTKNNTIQVAFENHKFIIENK